MQYDRNIPLEKGSFCLFYEKNYRGLGYLPFQEKIKQKWPEKLKMTFLNHFHHGGHSGAKAGTCEVHKPSSLALTATLSHVVAQSITSH